MASYLLDTNILLRGADDTSPQHVQAKEAVATLLLDGHSCFLTGQVLIEFWAVATRPVSANGLGWDTMKTEAEINQLRIQFPLLDEAPGVFAHWLSLVTAHDIKGKQVHDVRLVAVMKEHGVTHLLTFNVGDFPAKLGITVVVPSEVV